MKLSDLQIAQKLAIGFGSVTLTLLVMSGMVFTTARELTRVEHINDVSNDAVSYADRALTASYRERAELQSFYLTNHSGARQRADSAASDFQNYTAKLQSILTSEQPQLLPVLAEFTSVHDRWRKELAERQLELVGRPEGHQEFVDLTLSDKATALNQAIDSSATTLREQVNTWSDKFTVLGDRMIKTMGTVILLGAAIATSIAICMAWLITRAIAKPVTAMTSAMRALAAGDHEVIVPAQGRGDELGAMSEALQVFKKSALERLRLEREAEQAQAVAEADRAANDRQLADAAADQKNVVERIATGLSSLASGDLVQRIDVAFPAAYETLRRDFNAAVTQLQDTMKVIAGSAAAIRSGTTEISSASTDLSKRTEQQAASLENTAAALDEITATVRKTADGALQANKVVSLAREDASKSGDVVQQAVKAMEHIEKSSQQIGQIIGVIDEIAFQTNLLALNAGVEAARAGDAGKGFAVVASEVRALAQRSAEAAKEIKGLISTSNTQVSAGVQLVDEAGKALQRIASQVVKIDGIVGEIASSAQEQSIGLNEVNTAVNEMDQVTQQNAAMVEQSTAAAQSLAQETSELSNLINRFQIGESSFQEAIRQLTPSKPGGGRTVTRVRSSKQASAPARLKASTAGADDGWEEF